MPSKRSSEPKSSSTTYTAIFVVAILAWLVVRSQVKILTSNGWVLQKARTQDWATFEGVSHRRRREAAENLNDPNPNLDGGSGSEVVTISGGKEDSVVAVLLRRRKLRYLKWTKGSVLEKNLPSWNEQ